MLDVEVVVAVLFFAATMIGFMAYVAVQFGKRAVEAQQDFSSQLVNGLANKVSAAGAVFGGMTIDPDGRAANGANGRGSVQYSQRDPGQHRNVPEGFPRPTAAESV
jgi:hypothetical protein